MRVWWKRARLPLILPVPQRRPATLAERGQALIVIAMAMIGLLAFVGLTVDSGILFIGEGHLRRAVDAAALAAATQFRVGSNSDRLQVTAAEVVHMNGVDPTTLVLTICSPGDPHNDDALCPPPGSPHKKLVKVQATTKVTFAFLSIIGIPSTTITADATSETASVDVVLVIDTSNSMTFGIQDEIKGGYVVSGTGTVFKGNPLWDPAVCNVATPTDPTAVANGFTGNCLPFLYVKEAAVDFIRHLYFPYDRLSIVTFDNVPTVQVAITNTLTSDQVINWVKGNAQAGIGDGTTGLQVSPPRDPTYPGSPCTYNVVTQPDPSACTNTSTGGGLKLAGGQFGIRPIRQEAVWVVILLTDGAANATEPNASTGQINKYCPTSTWFDPVGDPNHYNPFCRDVDTRTRHTLLDPTTYGITHTAPYNPQNSYNAVQPSLNYDADDYARDNADFVSCPAKMALAPVWCRDSLDYVHGQGGQGALMFSIGLGGLVIDNTSGGGIANASASNGEARRDPTDPAAGYYAGDTLLRYIARVGLSGDPNGVDPCAAQPLPTLILPPDSPKPNSAVVSPGNLSYSCGNYYFAQFGTGLNSVFQSIASRIFTRITQ